MNMSIDGDNHVTKRQHSLADLYFKKTLSKLKIKENFLNLIKGIKEKLTGNIFNIPHDIRNELRKSIPPLLPHIVLEILAQKVTDSMMSYTENHKEYTNKLLKL